MLEKSGYVALWKLLQAKMTIREIAAGAQISTATVQKLKKEMLSGVRGLRIRGPIAERLCALARQREKELEEERRFFEEVGL